MTHDESVEQYFAAMYPNDKDAVLTDAQKSELSSILSALYDIQERLDDLAEEAGNLVILSASTMIDAILNKLEVFGVDEDMPASVGNEMNEGDDDDGTDAHPYFLVLHILLTVFYLDYIVMISP